MTMTTSSFLPKQSSMAEHEWQPLRELSQAGQDRSFGKHGSSPYPQKQEVVNGIPRAGNPSNLAPNAVGAYPYMPGQGRYPLATGSEVFQFPPTLTPRLAIFPERPINLSNCHISFSVHVMDMPVDVPLSACTIEGMVMTPSGITLPCQMRELERKGIHDPNLFSGVFLSTGEAGRYNVKVRLIFPFNLHLASEHHCGTVKEVQLLVSRNYFRESTKQSTESFLVDFVPWRHYSGGTHMQRYPESDGGGQGPLILSKVWGFTCDKLTNRFYRIGRNLTCLDAEGRVILRLPRPGSHLLLNRPSGICFDDVHRRLIVADKDDHTIRLFSLDGEHLSSVGERGHGNGQFSYPWDVAASPNGNLIAVTDSRNKRVQLLDYQGNFVNKFSVYEQNPYEYKNNFDYPRGITFSGDGMSIFVTDFNANNVNEVPLSMTMYRKLLPARMLDRPQGIITDDLGNLLFCDSKNECIRHVHPVSGQLLSTIRSIGPSRLRFPVNLALMGDGRLAVLDSLGKVRIF